MEKNRLALVLLIIVIMLTLIFFELILRIYPRILGQEFANAVLSKYSADNEGIYEYDPVLKMNFMKPNFKALMYYNGYEWEHKTDSRGFRNSIYPNKTDVVLLGDSLIYGHGLNYENTMGYFLIEKNISVTNLARQGDCSYQEMYLLPAYGIDLRPKYVFYFYFSNDLTDLFVYLTEKEIENFSSQDIDKIKFPKKAANLTINPDLDYRTKPYLYRALRYFLVKRISSNNNYNESLAWSYTQKSISYMKNISKANNIRFIIFPILTNNNSYDKDMPILKNYSMKNNISIIDTYFLINQSLYLKNDGHFNEAGHKKVADEIYKYILKN